MEGVATAVLGIEAAELSEEVMHFLDRSGRARVIATAQDSRQLVEAIRQLDPDVLVATPAMASATERVRGRALLCIDTSESVRGLRAAIGSGARGYFVWPGDRDALCAAISRPTPVADERPTTRGRLIAVHGVRGGVGTTSVAIGLATAWSAMDHRTVLLDLDVARGDVAAALAIGAEERVRTLADLLAIANELTPRRAEEILWRHPEGFGVVLAAAPSAAASTTVPSWLDADRLEVVVERLRAVGDIVAHVPSGADGSVRSVLATADHVVIVLAADGPSVRAAAAELQAAVIDRSRAVAALTPSISRSVGTREVARSLEIPVVTFPPDRIVRRASDRGHGFESGVPMRRASVRLARAVEVTVR